MKRIMMCIHPRPYYATLLSERVHEFLCANDERYGWMDTTQIAHYLKASYFATNVALNNLWKSGLIVARETSWSRGWYRGTEYSTRTHLVEGKES